MASILSVGDDIGTSTTQIIFSRIDMENKAGSDLERVAAKVCSAIFWSAT